LKRRARRMGAMRVRPMTGLNMLVDLAHLTVDEAVVLRRMRPSN
jgi:hypothetical protein